MSLVPYHPREGREIVLYVIDLVLSPSIILLQHPPLASLNTPPAIDIWDRGSRREDYSTASTEGLGKVRDESHHGPY